MRILYIGAGFVGACSAAVAADSGHDVLVYDIDPHKITKLGSGNHDDIESVLFEEGLSDLLNRNKERISFTNDYIVVNAFLDTCDAIFICVATPENKEGSGETDITYYRNALEKLSAALSERNKGEQNKYIVLVNKSTVPIQLIKVTDEILKNHGVKNVGVASNPEFLVEGKAIEGSMRPDRVVVGAWNEQDFAVLRQLYRRFYDSPTVTYIESNPYEAAAGKLLANYLLFNKLVTTFQVVGRVSEVFPEIKFENLRTILTTDSRIGSWGFFDSLYAGGSCLIKDSASLSFQLKQQGANTRHIDDALLGNTEQLEHFLNRAEKEGQFAWSGITVALIGLAFKRDTNDIRNSAVIPVIEFLLKKGVREIRAYDPAAIPMTQHYMKTLQESEQNKIVFCNSEKDAILGTSASVILTDWPQFKTLHELFITQTKKQPYVILDGRRMLQHAYSELQSHGFSIIAVGSPYLPGKS